MLVIGHLTIYRGTALRLRLTLQTKKDAAGVTNDITGWTTRFVMRPKSSSPTVTLTKGGAVDSVSDQRFTVDILDTDTTAMAPGTYVAAFERVDAGAEELLGRYIVTVSRDVIHGDS